MSVCRSCYFCLDSGHDAGHFYRQITSLRITIADTSPSWTQGTLLLVIIIICHHHSTSSFWIHHCHWTLVVPVALGPTIGCPDRRSSARVLVLFARVACRFGDTCPGSKPLILLPALIVIVVEFIEPLGGFLLRRGRLCQADVRPLVGCCLFRLSLPGSSQVRLRGSANVQVQCQMHV